jgi:hypothetical protein
MNENLKQHAKNQAEITKLLAETLKINNENKWARLAVGAFASLVIIVTTKLIMN